MHPLVLLHSFCPASFWKKHKRHKTFWHWQRTPRLFPNRPCQFQSSILCSSLNGFDDVVLPDCLYSNACKLKRCTQPPLRLKKSTQNYAITSQHKPTICKHTRPFTVAPTPMAAPRLVTKSVLGARAVSRSWSKVSAADSLFCFINGGMTSKASATSWHKQHAVVASNGRKFRSLTSDTMESWKAKQRSTVRRKKQHVRESQKNSPLHRGVERLLEFPGLGGRGSKGNSAQKHQRSKVVRQHRQKK